MILLSYVCPTCKQEFDNEEMLVKHFLKCWSSSNPQHKSKPAPRSADVVTTTVNDDVSEFFSSLKEGVCRKF